MVTIEQWFSGQKDYSTGLVLLQEMSKNKFLLQGLMRKKNQSKLEYELSKFASVKPVQAKQTPEIHLKVNPSAESERRRVVRGTHEINYDDLPRELKARWDQNRDNYKLIRSNHEKLKLMEKASDADRAKLTQKIIEMDDRIRANWEVIDNWDPNAKHDVPGLDHKRINANRKFICTNLVKIATVEDQVKKAKIAQNLQDRYNELKNANEVFAPDTIAELTQYGIEC